MYRGGAGRTFWLAIWRKLGYIAAAAAVGFAATQCHAAQCVVIDGGGALIADAAPVESCTGFVLSTAAEFTDLQGFWSPLTVEQGATIGVAIFVAWATAFGLRQLRRVIEEG